MTPLKASYFRKWNNWLINAPKAYTKAHNMQSPGYARVVSWISEAWNELDSNLIARSFQHCGITSRNPADYGNQLRHFVRTNELVDTIVNDEMGSDDIFGGDGDEWDEETQAILDSESEDDENEQ
jgi:hypothetical protein